MTENTQPVAQEAQTTAQPGEQDSGAQTDDLASLLSTFNGETAKPPQPAPTQPAGTELAALRAEIDAIRQERFAERDQASAIKEIKGDLDIPDYIVRGWIGDRGDAEPGINKIWNSRGNDPASAKKLIAALAKDFRKEQAAYKKSQPDPDATADVAAVTAAVRGASTRQPEDKQPNYGSMNDADFKKELAKFGL